MTARTAAPRRQPSRLQRQVDELGGVVAAEELRRDVATGEHTAPLPDLPRPPEPIEWARRHLAAGGDVPAYGSPEWHALPDGDARRWLAALAAAEAWRAYWSPEEHARRLRTELHAARVNWQHEEAAGYAAVAAGLPASVFTPRPAPFGHPRELVDVEDWPPVRRPPR